MVFCDGGPRVNTIRREKPERNIENETFVETRVSENTTKTEFHKKKKESKKDLDTRNFVHSSPRIAPLSKRTVKFNDRRMG